MRIISQHLPGGRHVDHHVALFLLNHLENLDGIKVQHIRLEKSELAGQGPHDDEVVRCIVEHGHRGHHQVDNTLGAEADHIRVGRGKRHHAFKEFMGKGAVKNGLPHRAF